MANFDTIFKLRLCVDMAAPMRWALVVAATAVGLVGAAEHPRVVRILAAPRRAAQRSSE